MELLQSFFQGPVLPATLLLLFMVGWNVLAMLSAADLELPEHLDVDLDADLPVGKGAAVDYAAESLGILAVRWLNIHRVPLLIWLGSFALIWWLLSALLWWCVDSRWFLEPGMWLVALLTAKNVALALLVTKWVTKPMCGWFELERFDSGTLIGAECTISSLEANPEFGQVRFKTDGAPLLLNVRTDGSFLSRGTCVWITHYDAENKVYIVSETGTKSVDETPLRKEPE